MESMNASAADARDAARSDQLDQLQQLFPSGDQGLGYSMGALSNALADLANSPADASARQVVLQRATDLASRFSAGGQQVATLQLGINADLKSSAGTVNGLAASLAALNQKIAGYHGLAQAPNDLLDQRDELVSQISSLVQVTTLPAPDGTLGVFLGGGQRLVLGNVASQLAVVADPADPSRSALTLSTGNNDALTLHEDKLGGGSMAGLLSFQNQDLVRARNQLGQMASALGHRFNTAQAMGLDLSDPGGPGAPLFSMGPPVALPNAYNAQGPNGPLASVALTVTDATQLQASDYDLTPDGSGTPGQYRLTRLSDGSSRTVADGAVFDGFRINVGTPDLSPGDHFLLKPVGGAALGMARALDDPNGIAAASPLTVTMAAANTGTASVASFDITDRSVNPQLSAKISFTSGSGAYNWELRDRDTNAVVSSGSAQWKPGQPISLNGFALQLNGVPASGDEIDVDKTLYPRENNGNALAMVGLRDEAFVGRYARADGSIADGATPTDAYATALAEVGVQVQAAHAQAAVSKAVSDQAGAALSAKTGVNLDEEASRLIQYQQSYQAAAKVLQVAQSVFDTLIQMGAH
jgi:flagellar hook-associated protein 1 FlgK